MKANLPKRQSQKKPLILIKVGIEIPAWHSCQSLNRHFLVSNIFTNSWVSILFYTYYDNTIISCILYTLNIYKKWREINKQISDLSITNTHIQTINNLNESRLYILTYVLITGQNVLKIVMIARLFLRQAQLKRKLTFVTRNMCTSFLMTLLIGDNLSVFKDYHQRL